MDIIKTKSGKKAVRVYDKNGMVQLYSLRKIAVLGITAVSLAAAIASPYIIKEINYNHQMNDVYEAEHIADEIEAMRGKANIEIDGNNYYIPDEIRDYASAKEDLANAKYNSDKENIAKAEESLKQEQKDIYEIAKQVIKDTVKPTLENPEAGEIALKKIATPDGPEYTAKQNDKYGKTETKILSGDFLHYTLGNDDSHQQIIEMLPDTLSTGEGIRIK